MTADAPAGPFPRVSIVIVNYNAGDHLPRCLESLRRQTMRDYELIVVDNASQDGSMAAVEDFPNARAEYNEENRGFAAGQNQGFALARAPFILALNYDLVMRPTFLEKFVSALAADPSAGWACAKLLNMSSDGEPLSTFYAAGHTLEPDRFPRLRGNGMEDRGQYNRREYVFGAPGAAALYRRELIQSAELGGGFFDESFFTWFEDVDIDWRAQNLGWKCLYVPEAVAYHVGHVGEEYTEPFRSFRVCLHIRNRWLSILANERSPNLWALLKYELESFLWVSRVGLLRAYFSAVFSALKRLPATWLKRQALLAMNAESPMVMAGETS